MSSKKEYTPAPPADFVLPFDLKTAGLRGLRGRVVRLEGVSTRALSAHPLPEAAQRVLAEALALSVLLGSALKLNGRLSVQTRGKGPLSFVVADYFAPQAAAAAGAAGVRGGVGAAGVRGYAKLDEGGFAALEAKNAFGALSGEGTLAITIEPNPGAQSYQGVVPLSADGLAVSAQNYFAQSEQLPTLLRLAAGPIYRAGEGTGWRAGGLMIQAVPGRTTHDIEQSDVWSRMALFLQTLEAVELLDTGIAAETVLWRLFHEDEVRAYPAQSLLFCCTCNAEKLLPVLRSYPEGERKDLADADSIIRTRCEFCGTIYEFPMETLNS